MYTAPQKRFKPKALDALEADIANVKAQGLPIRCIFLAGGDAMTLSTRRLRDILQLIHRHFPDVQGVAAYCLPRNIARKAPAEMQELNALGLSLM